MVSKGNSVPAVGTVIVLAVLTSLSGCLSSCNSTKNVGLAKDAVSRFHSLLDSEQYHVIYADADELFRSAGSEADMSAFLQAVHRKLGQVEFSQLQTISDSWYAGRGNFLVLTYVTTFSDATGTESFTWRISGGRAILVGYNVNSKALILK